MKYYKISAQEADIIGVDVKGAIGANGRSSIMEDGYYIMAQSEKELLKKHFKLIHDQVNWSNEIQNPQIINNDMDDPGPPVVNTEEELNYFN